jgi:hypothetical protein
MEQLMWIAMEFAITVHRLTPLAKAEIQFKTNKGSTFLYNTFEICDYSEFPDVQSYFNTQLKGIQPMKNLPIHVGATMPGDTIPPCCHPNLFQHN